MQFYRIQFHNSILCLDPKIQLQFHNHSLSQKTQKIFVNPSPSLPFPKKKTSHDARETFSIICPHSSLLFDFLSSLFTAFPPLSASTSYQSINFSSSNMPLYFPLFLDHYYPWLMRLTSILALARSLEVLFLTRNWLIENFVLFNFMFFLVINFAFFIYSFICKSKPQIEAAACAKVVQLV